jgi:hypothetical protein
LGWRLNLYVLKVGHGFICIKVRIISINIIVNVQLARVGTSKHTPGAYVCVSSEAWTTVGENCVELCSSGCRPASVGQL